MLRVVVMIAGAAFATGCARDFPDETAIALFEAHEEKFSKIASMLDEDHARCVEARSSEGDRDCDIAIFAMGGKVLDQRLIETYKVDLRTGPKDFISVKRLEAYISLANQIGLRETMFQRLDKTGEIHVTYHRHGLAVAGTLREFVYRPTDPTPSYDTLEIPLSEPVPTETWRQGYRQIRDDWYLFVSYD